jgi:hypothetical protein
MKTKKSWGVSPLKAVRSTRGLCCPECGWDILDPNSYEYIVGFSTDPHAPSFNRGSTAETGL